MQEQPIQKRRKGSVIETVEPLLAEAARESGVCLYDIEYIKEGGNRILRLYIDNENGVDLNDCEKVSRAADTILDEHDPIPESYVLEVSSPGIERRLRKDEHFTRYIGEKVEVRLYKPFEGRKKFIGILNGIKEGNVSVTSLDGADYSFSRQSVALCKLSVFD